MKRMLSILLAVMLLVAVMPASAFAASTKTVYVSRDDSNSRIYFRAGAGYDYVQKGTVYHNDKVTVLKSGDTWSKIKIVTTKGSYKGKTGWIRSYYIDGTTKKLCTGSRALKSATKLYSSASTTSTVRASLSKGQAVKVYYFDHDFCKVVVNSTGKYGWVPMRCVGSKTSEESTSGSGNRIYHTTASTLNVRSGPGTSYKVINQLSRNTACCVLESSGNWRRIKTYKGVTGWVSNNYLTANATGKVSTNGGRLNVRQSPSTGAAILGSLNNGASVTGKYVNGNWVYLTSGSLTGWSSLSYLKF